MRAQRAYLHSRLGYRGECAPMRAQRAYLHTRRKADQTRHTQGEWVVPDP